MAGATVVAADTHALRLLRAVKDAGEIERVRAAIRICDSGQAAARGALRAGASELEAWGAVQTAMQIAAGGRLSVACDFVTGERTAAMGGPPGLRTMRAGDLAIVDLVPRLAGWFGDSCSTISLGEAPAEVRSAHARCSEALERGLAALAPGWSQATSTASSARASTTRTTRVTESESRRTRNRASSRAARPSWHRE